VNPLAAAGLAVVAVDVVGLLLLATFFSVATGIGAHLKGRFAGPWMTAGFLLGPLAFVFLLFSSDG